MLSRTKLLVLVMTLGAGTAFAQTPAGEAPAMDPKKAAEMQKMMEAWQKFATPGPEHAKLKSLAGSYDIDVTFWMDPKGPPETSKAKAELKMIMGDRYLQQEVTGEMMGQPFNGMAITGYDNAKKKYVSTWIDSVGTGIFRSEGTADKSGNTINFQSEQTDPMTGKITKGRDIWKWDEAGNFTSEMWGKGPKGGKEYKQMEIKYSKKK